MQYLHSSPDIMGGDLVIKGTRVPIEVILYRLKDGYSVDRIHELYPWVDRQGLESAIKESLEKAIGILATRQNA